MCFAPAMHCQTLYRSSELSVTAIKCRPQNLGRGGLEAQAFHSLAFVRRGAYRYHRGREDIIIDPLTAMFWARDDAYSVSHPFGCGDDCLEFRFSEEALREARPALRRTRMRNELFTTTRTAPISADICLALRLLAKRLECGLAARLEVEEIALNILGAAGRAENTANGGVESPPARTQARSKRKVEQAKELMLSDLGRNWSLHEVAAAVGASPFHLTRLVRTNTGSALHRYLTHQRLAASLQCLLDGAGSITKVALDGGFSSHSHFSAAFKKEYGVTPNAVRRSYGQVTGRQNADTEAAVRGRYVNRRALRRS